MADNPKVLSAQPFEVGTFRRMQLPGGLQFMGETR